MRYYVAASPGLLRVFAEDGTIPVAVERFTAADEQEESEYAALLDAADASAALIDAETGRRVVIVVESGAGDGEPLAMGDVVAVHADTSPVDPLDEDPPELAWFAAQEIPDLIDGPTDGAG